LSTIELVSRVRSFGGYQERYSHYSTSNDCNMTFGVYLPPQRDSKTILPALWWLSGLTCTDENFVQKAGAQQTAAALGLILITPDTSPRGDAVPDDPENAWDFGVGAGFYVNATEAPWARNYQMFDYINMELPTIIAENFPWNGKAAISGHSMGGHGALVSALKYPDKYRSVSAFAPISNPCQCPWGIKAFENYLGSDKKTWCDYDSCELLKENRLAIPGLVDQGSKDVFLQQQLKIDHLQEAITRSGSDIQVGLHADYDHSYFFVASFIEKHLKFHHQCLSDN